MSHHQKIQDITNIDIVTLKHFADAQIKQEPTPPAFNDTLMRLSVRGFIRGDHERSFTVTPKGKSFLSSLDQRPH